MKHKSILITFIQVTENCKTDRLTVEVFFKKGLQYDSRKSLDIFQLNIQIPVSLSSYSGPRAVNTLNIFYFT